MPLVILCCYVWRHEHSIGTISFLSSFTRLLSFIPSLLPPFTLPSLLFTVSRCPKPWMGTGFHNRCWVFLHCSHILQQLCMSLSVHFSLSLFSLPSLPLLFLPFCRAPPNDPNFLFALVFFLLFFISGPHHEDSPSDSRSPSFVLLFSWLTCCISCFSCYYLRGNADRYIELFPTFLSLSFFFLIIICIF